MKDLHSNNGSHMYPGEYVPLLKPETFSRILRDCGRKELQLPELTVSALPHYYRVTLGVPGVKREDFTIRAAGNQLSVYVIHKAAKGPPEYQYMERHVTLPQHADISFSTAEYRDDILTLYISKAKAPAIDTKSSVVVY